MGRYYKKRRHDYENHGRFNWAKNNSSKVSTNDVLINTDGK